MKRFVFCDFDGTITAEETFVGMLKHFAPELSAELMPQMYALTLTLREGVRQLLESIPADRYPEILAYAQTCALRSGFAPFLQFLQQEHIPFVVVSGGLRGMVETVLQPYLPQVLGIHAVDVNTTGSLLQVQSDFEGETELVSKVDVIYSYNPDFAIAIGDSVTDLNMAMAADLVFARDRLANYLDERGKPYRLWQDFDDIQAQLSTMAWV